MSTHGGARPGAGRKPTRERFASAVAKAEKKIADNLPVLVDTLLEEARGGDTKAAQYLIDRILGKPVAVQEITGQDGGPLQVQAQVQGMLDRLYGDAPAPPAVDTEG